MGSFVRRHFYPILIVVITLIISFLNYKSGTFLTGWDTLHPELNFSLNFQRVFDGVWREEQGLGAIAGHSHMADLPRIIFLWLTHFFLPLNSLRYVYIFLCFVLGPLGIFYLIKYLLKGTRQWRQPYPLIETDSPTDTRNVIVFLASLFYIFNLSTVQIFYVPFEMFPVQYASLPWVILYALKYLKESGKKNLFLFALITLFSTPQAYAAHLWIAYMPIFGMFLGFWFLLERNRIAFKKAVVLIAVTLAVNSFWLIPHLYFNSYFYRTPIETKQNRLFSQEYLLRNREFGNIKDVALVRGFLFDWGIRDYQNDLETQLMKKWQIHLSDPLILLFGYTSVAFALIGAVLSIMRKERVYLALLPFLAVPFILLANNTPPFSWFFDLLTQNELLRETLRFVFTKFSHPLLFSFVVYFSYALFVIFGYLKELNRRLLVIILTIGFIAFGFPFFQGHLIHPGLRVNIPQKYFTFWNFMNKQEDGVVLSLPLHNFAGWTYYEWGYQGSGFLWFGMKQPLLDRDNDRWSKSNERAYRELSYALYAQNPKLFASNLKKFNISYLEIDKDVTTSNRKNEDQILYVRETEKLLTQLERDKVLGKIYNQNGIRVYKTHAQKIVSAQVVESAHIKPSYEWTFEDTAYTDLGNYFTTDSDDNQNAVYYPFHNILTKTDRLENSLLDIDPNTNSYFLKTTLPKKGILNLPNLKETEKILFVNVYVQRTLAGNQLIMKPLLPKGLLEDITRPLPAGSQSVRINDEEFPLIGLSSNTPVYLGQAYLLTRLENKINGLPVQIALPTKTGQQPLSALTGKFALSKTEFDAKSLFKFRGQVEEISLENNNQALRFHSKDDEVGIVIGLNNLPHNTGYIVSFTSRNREGMPMRICLKNLYSGICNLYDELSRSSSTVSDYFVVPPYENGIGYNLHIDNISYGNYKSVNELDRVTIMPFPYRFLSGLSVSPQEGLKKEKIAVLPSSYHPGWKAYQNGEELKKQVLVNNWANGWILPATRNTQHAAVQFVFWPQYLEIAGFGLMISAFLFILLKRDKT